MHAMSHEGKAVYQLSVCREITVYTIGRLRSQLIRQLTGKREIEIDCSMVRQVDRAGIEGILALRDEASRRHVTLRFVSRNQAFLRLLEQMETTIN